MAIIFWIAVLSFLNWGAALVKAIVDPQWYHRKRFEAGFDVEIGHAPTSFKFIKIVQLIILGVVITWTGSKIGYW